jgi:glycosyltransferase involved in cell wall biosynthesis
MGRRMARPYGSSRVRLLKLAANQGKGGAVQQGMLHARGALLLMVDADGASKFDDVAKLERELAKVAVGGHGIAVGSRRHLQQDAVANRAWHRNLMMYVSNYSTHTYSPFLTRASACSQLPLPRTHHVWDDADRRWVVSVCVLCVCALSVCSRRTGRRWTSCTHWWSDGQRSDCVRANRTPPNDGRRTRAFTSSSRHSRASVISRTRNAASSSSLVRRLSTSS